MSTKYISNLLVLGVVATAGLVGCGEPPTPESNPNPDASEATLASDHDDVHITEDDVERPADYAAAVARIKSYRNTIRDECAAGRPNKAHRPLDEMNFVVEWLPEIAQQSDVPKEHWEALNTSAQRIRTLLDRVHEKIDNKQDPDFESVAEDIQKEIDTLGSIQKSHANRQTPGVDGNESDAPDEGEHQ